MSLLFRSAPIMTSSETAGQAIADRTASRSYVNNVNETTALRHSAAWAAQRLRADIVSTLPWDVYRRSADGYLTPTSKPLVLQEPGGPRCPFPEWAYSSQIDLDRYGNTVGIIVARDGAGRPAQIELQEMDRVRIEQKDGRLTYFIGAKSFDPSEVWHERQYTFPGKRLGMSPVAYAKYSLGQYMAAQDFGENLYKRAARPSGTLRNSRDVLTAAESSAIKDRYLAMMEEGGIFVTGNDWEFEPLVAAEADTRFLEVQQSSATDIARYYNVPADLIDAAVTGSSLTYANIGQRNLQFLIMHLNPALRRREDAFTRYLTANGARFEFNRDALLSMDPQTRATVNQTRLNSGELTVTEVRAIENRRPYTDEQWAEFDRVKGRPATPQTTPDQKASA